MKTIQVVSRRRSLRFIAYGAMSALIGIFPSYAAANVNDLFVNRIDLGTVANFNVTGTNVGFSAEPGEPTQSGPINSAWWQWTAPENSVVTIDTFGSNFDTVLTVATGTAVDALTVLAQNDDAPVGSPQSEITFDAVAGTQYKIAVDGFAGNTGSIALNLNSPFLPTVPLDHFLCYEAKTAEEEPKFEWRDVDLEDQFGATTKTVKKPKFLCTPVVKDGEGVVDLQDSEGHLVCYEVKGQDKFEKRDVLVFNQFEDEGRILTVKKPKILCVPSEKVEVFQVEDEEDDDEDDDGDDDD